MRRTVLALVLLLSACGSQGATPSGTPAPPSTMPSATASAQLSVLGICHGGKCPIAPGTYMTASLQAFWPGLVLTIPPGWFATEQDTGELSLHPNDHPDDQLVLWKDVEAVTSNHRTLAAGTPLANICRTPDALAAWLTSNPDFTVLSQPAPARVGKDAIGGTILSLQTSKTANYADPGCPSNPRCADLVADTKHWGTEFFGIGGDESVRLFMATVSAPGGDHTFFVVLDTPSSAELVRFSP
jgi:hypothetical protein